MSLSNALFHKAIQDKNADLLRDLMKLEHPDQTQYHKYVIMEYNGVSPRLFGDNHSIELLIPKEMDLTMENAVVDAIESGTIFDDKQDIENKVSYIGMTQLPNLGLQHTTGTEPIALKRAVGAVVGPLHHDGHFGSDETDLSNGQNYVKDLMDHGDEKEDSVDQLTDDYLEIKEKHGPGNPSKFHCDLGKVSDEIHDIKKVKAEDTVCDDDCEDVEICKKDECGDIDIEKESSFDTKPIPRMPKTEFSESYQEYSYDELFEEGLMSTPKKLKPIPRDVIAYIATQKNAIRDANDQSMIASYCCAKLELVDFYLNCIDTRDYRYIVPHNRQYLVQMQNDLNRLLQEILRVKPIQRQDRPWRINVVYPPGWGG